MTTATSPPPAYDFAEEFQRVFIPAQKGAPPPQPASMAANLSSYPPLGQVTKLRSGRVSVVALLEVPASRASEAWQVSLWHSQDGGDWQEVDLQPVAPEEERSVAAFLQEGEPGLVGRYFSTAAAPLEVERSVHFTLKFRAGDAAEWRWIRDEKDLHDGVLVVAASDGSTSLAGVDTEGVDEDLGGIIKNLNASLVVRREASQSPGTKLWSIKAPVPAAKGEDSTYADVELGIPWGGFLRWFALVRLWTPWLAPRHGKESFALDKDAVMVSFLSAEGKHMVALAVSGLSNHVSTVIRNGDAGNVKLHLRNDGEADAQGTVLVAVGDEFESANAAVMYHARTLTMAAKEANVELEKEVKSLADEVKAEWLENWYDGLGYCTWNALGQRLTDEKIFSALNTLKANKINISNLIIDDNWQSIDYRGPSQFQYGWQDFEAEAKSFPRGLKATIHQIREAHPNIQHVAVWHALLGYWGGLSADGALAKKYKTVVVQRDEALRRNLPLGGPMTVVAKEDVARFYNDFYRFLVFSEIDGVKTDAQFMLDTWASARHRRELAQEYLDAWTVSTLRHFSSRAISCMSQTPDILFHSQLPRNRPAILCRNSDDFFPEIESSHPWHVWSNAHNALLTQHLNVLPDWDMFQTVHDYSGFHAAARCVSGGPIYITDVPGQHNIDLIGQMTGQTPRGKTVIFRPSVLGKSIDQYAGYDDDQLLKVGCYNGAAVTGAPMLGVFNISSRPLTELVPLSRIPGVLPSLQYVVRSHSTGRISPPLGAPQLLRVSLPVRGHDILSVFPLSAFHAEPDDDDKPHRDLGTVRVANLGLVGKMAGAAAIVWSRAELLPTGRVAVDAKLKALGTLGLYVSALPRLSIDDDFMVMILGQAVPVETVRVSDKDEHVLEVDVATAWEKLGLSSGWSNEVEVKIYFRIE